MVEQLNHTLQACPQAATFGGKSSWAGCKMRGSAAKVTKEVAAVSGLKRRSISQTQKRRFKHASFMF